jgi:uncharacterized protein (DUF924 family)
VSACAEVLSFWFAPGRAAQWFVADPGFDRLVRRRLAPRLDAVLAGAHGDWLDSARGCLALCVLLDQVPRNLYRDEPGAYANDARARAVARHALARRFDRELAQDERLFLYMPLQHSEALADQRDSLCLIGALDANPRWRQDARRHHDIIARFGRFPHRNAALGRAATPEETAFLAEPGSSF